jgi:hypothetical protein
MIFFILFNLVYLSLINVHNSIQEQIIEKIQEKLAAGDYASLDLDDHYVLHLFKLDRSGVVIERYDKLKGITHTIFISLNEHLDEDLNLKDTIKQKIIRKLYSFEDTGVKYLCILEEDDLYKNEVYLFDFLKNLSSHVNFIENYDESKDDYIKYKNILRNSYLFSFYTYDEEFGYVFYFCKDFDKELFSLVLLGKSNKLYFFTFDLNSLDKSEYFRYYCINTKGLSEEDANTLSSFFENFNLELYQIGFNFKIISKAGENFLEKRNVMNSENIRLTRKIDLEINDHQMVWNSVCFSPTEERKFDEGLKYFKISKNQLEEIKRFNSDINKVNLHDLEKINELMNLLKGSELCRKILENILNNQDSGKGLILINILYSLAMITKSQFEDFLYYRSAENICINDIIRQINSHYASVRFSLYNILLYSELEDIANSHDDDVSFFRDFSQIISMYSIKELMNLPNIDHLTMLEKLHVFTERVYYKPNFRTLKFNLCHSTGIHFFVCKLLSHRLIVDDNLILLNTKDYFEEDYMQMIYDQMLMREKNSLNEYWFM